MVSASRILGDQVGSTAPVFLAILAVHVIAGLTAVITGAIAALARKGSPRHIRAGRWYYRAITALFATATALAAMRWAQDYYLLILGAVAFTAATIGYLHRRRHRPGDTGHIAGMGIAYTAMLTAFYVDNGPHLPLWDRLPTLAFWLLPSAIAAPIIIRAIIRHRSNPAARAPAAVPAQARQPDSSPPEPREVARNASAASKETALHNNSATAEATRLPSSWTWAAARTPTGTPSAHHDRQGGPHVGRTLAGRPSAPRLRALSLRVFRPRCLVHLPADIALPSQRRIGPGAAGFQATGSCRVLLSAVMAWGRSGSRPIAALVAGDYSGSDELFHVVGDGRLGQADGCGASVLAGAVRSVFTLTEATLVADQWRQGRYAVLNVVFSAPLTAAGAVAPSIGAGIAAAVGSYPALFIVLAATAAADAALAVTVPSPAGPHNPGAGSGDSDQARREPPDPLG